MSGLCTDRIVEERIGFQRADPLAPTGHGRLQPTGSAAARRQPAERLRRGREGAGHRPAARRRRHRHGATRREVGHHLRRFLLPHFRPHEERDEGRQEDRQCNRRSLLTAFIISATFLLHFFIDFIIYLFILFIFFIFFIHFFCSFNN